MAKLVVKRANIIKDYKVVFTKSYRKNKEKVKIRNNPKRKGRIYND